jgi:hypothetical protein
MVFRSTLQDSSWSDVQNAWLSERTLASESHEHLLTEWLQPRKLEWGAQGSGTLLEGTAQPQEKQASQLVLMKPMPSEEPAVAPPQPKREERVLVTD